MARKSKAEQQFSAIVASVQFHPTPEQRDAKSAFWLAVQSNPVVDLAHITMAGIIHMTGQSKVEKWWSQPGFQEWFTNREEFRMKLESATHMAIGVLMEIMGNPDANAAARVAAAKMVIEAAGKNEGKQRAEPEVSDKRIQGMSEQQLEAYIARHAGLLEAQDRTEEED
jgi:hypothetical protein